MGVASRTWSRGLVCAIIALLMGGIAPARAQFTLEPAFPDRAPLGPTHALGAIIWNHGKPPYRGADGDVVPFYLDRLRDAGWDVFRLDRDWASDNLVLSPAALRDEVSAVYAQGYRKLVLAGQSYGAWISLMVAASGPPIHAVIATAPAAFGRYPDSPVYRRNADELYPMLERVRGTRVMLFLFQDDAYDPGDRATPARAILEHDGVDNAVIGYPRGWLGHGAANSSGFATRFAPCIARFIDPRRTDGDAHCERDPLTRDAAHLDLPVGLMQARSAAGDPAGGLWYGVYGSGREALLALDAAEGGKVSALYAWGVQERGEADAPGYDRRIGRVIGDRLHFAEAGLATLDVAPLGPDRMRLTWTSSDGTRTDHADLRRLR